MEVGSPVDAVQRFRVLVVCQAGIGVGLGHLTRALVVARAMHHEMGSRVHLLVQGDAIMLDAADAFTYNFVPSQTGLVDVVTAWVHQYAPELLVFDLHPKLIPSDMGSMLVELRKRGCKLIAVDAFGSYCKLLDLVFIPAFNFQIPPLQQDQVAKFVFGWDCLLVDVPKPKGSWQPGKNVLALTGGSDATGLGNTWPVQLNKELPIDTDLHWVTGPFARAPVWPEWLRIQMNEHVAPTSLNDLINCANYAITVYGVSFYELLFCGVPTVVFSPYGAKDNADLMAIEAFGVALVAMDERDAIRKLTGLMASDKVALRLSVQARKFMNHSGGHKFAGCAFLILNGGSLNGKMQTSSC